MAGAMAAVGLVPSTLRRDELIRTELASPTGVFDFGQPRVSEFVLLALFKGK